MSIRILYETAASTIYRITPNNKIDLHHRKDGITLKLQDFLSLRVWKNGYAGISFISTQANCLSIYNIRIDSNPPGDFPEPACRSQDAHRGGYQYGTELFSARQQTRRMHAATAAEIEQKVALPGIGPGFGCKKGNIAWPNPYCPLRARADRGCKPAMARNGRRRRGKPA